MSAGRRLGNASGGLSADNKIKTPEGNFRGFFIAKFHNKNTDKDRVTLCQIKQDYELPCKNQVV